MFRGSCSRVSMMMVGVVFSRNLFMLTYPSMSEPNVTINSQVASLTITQGLTLGEIHANNTTPPKYAANPFINLKMTSLAKCE